MNETLANQFLNSKVVVLFYSALVKWGSFSKWLLSSKTNTSEKKMKHSAVSQLWLWRATSDTVKAWGGTKKMPSSKLQRLRSEPSMTFRLLKIYSADPVNWIITSNTTKRRVFFLAQDFILCCLARLNQIPDEACPQRREGDITKNVQPCDNHSQYWFRNIEFKEKKLRQKPHGYLNFPRPTTEITLDIGETAAWEWCIPC